MISLSKYIDSISETPKQSYNGIIQATINSEWEDTTQIYTVQEQNAYPFEDSYEDIEVLLDTISDDMINPNKVYSDFVRIIFKDCTHKQNYKGQYYRIAIDNDDNYETYICYDRINKLARVAECKVVRCNNVLTLQDENGNIITMPCYLGTDISSTNNQIAKSATIPNARMIIMIQANDYIKHIRNNQRFMFQHSTCFKVEEINDFMQEQGTNGEITCVKIYVVHDTMLPVDNKELNICNYHVKNNEPDIEKEEKKLVVNPYDNVSIKQGKYKDFICGVYIKDEKQDDEILYDVNWSDNEHYNIVPIDNGYRINCIKYSEQPLIIIFSANGCDDIIVHIELRRLV